MTTVDFMKALDRYVDVRISINNLHHLSNKEVGSEAIAIMKPELERSADALETELRSMLVMSACDIMDVHEERYEHERR